jgi:hypothetical protein
MVHSFGLGDDFGKYAVMFFEISRPKRVAEGWVGARRKRQGGLGGTS